MCFLLRPPLLQPVDLQLVVEWRLQEVQGNIKYNQIRNKYGIGIVELGQAEETKSLYIWKMRRGVKQQQKWTKQK